MLGDCLPYSLTTTGVDGKCDSPYYSHELDKIFSPMMSENFPEEEADPAYINRMMTREEVRNKKKQEELEAYQKQGKERTSRTLSEVDIRGLEMRPTWQRLFKIVYVLSWGKVISRFNEQKLVERFYKEAKDRDYKFRMLRDSDMFMLANLEDYLQEAYLLGMLEEVGEYEYQHILGTIGKEHLFKNSKIYDISN